GRRIVEECLVDGERWLTGSAGSLGFDEIRIATCRQRELEGLTLAALARQTGKTPAEAMLDLLREERATVGMVSFSQNLENVAKVLRHPAIMIGSDSIGLSEGTGPKHGKPHPRMYGTFPRVLGEYARTQKLFPPVTTPGRAVEESPCLQDSFSSQAPGAPRSLARPTRRSTPRPRSPAPRWPRGTSATSTSPWRPRAPRSTGAPGRG